MPISLPADGEADELPPGNALALLIAMLLDKQAPLERAFPARRSLARRLGHGPAAEDPAALHPEALAAVRNPAPPAIGPFPADRRVSG